MNYSGLFWICMILFLLYIVFMFIDRLTADDLVYFGKRAREAFEVPTTRTINMPLNTRYSCQNFCGPTSRCAITGQQCFTDMDCSGCQPVDDNKPTYLENVPGDNSSGKLTVGQTPQYSSLTGGFGTQETTVNPHARPAQPMFGVNVWKSNFDQTQQLFDARYKPGNLEFKPFYSPAYSLTGEFMSDGPLPSNY